MKNRLNKQIINNLKTTLQPDQTELSRFLFDIKDELQKQKPADNPFRIWQAAIVMMPLMVALLFFPFPGKKDKKVLHPENIQVIVEEIGRIPSVKTCIDILFSTKEDI